MTDFVVYILYAEKFGKIYVGQTTNLIARFKSHNYLGTKGWTRKYRPWIVIHVEVYNTRSNALKREKKLKSGTGRKWIKQNLNLWINGSYPPEADAGSSPAPAPATKKT